MNHRASPRFWKSYEALPEAAQELANSCFALMKANPAHPSLRFKKAGRFWTVRVGLHYRALAVEDDTGLVWFWIGSHAEYDRLLQG